MSERVRAFDWSNTPLGPESEWPESLKTIVRVLLTSRYAMWMGWGPDLTFLYNDTYGRVTLGKKHPWALGRPAREVWAEIWPEIGPRIEQVLRTGEATWDEGLLLFLERSGYPEETYHTFSYSPLEEKGSNTGMLCVVTEETERVIGERRLRSLREIAAELATATTEQEVLRAVCRVLERNQKDIPFSLTYLLHQPDRGQLAASSGIDPNNSAAPAVIDKSSSGWPLFDPYLNKQVLVENLNSRFSDLPRGAWNEPPRSAVLVPLLWQKRETPLGFLVVGLNPFRQFDAEYAGFIDLIAGQISAGISNARAYDEERRRAEALVALDQAKTLFFTNISHEFRTPLTLMIGPLEALIGTEADTARFSDLDRSELQRIYRNAIRLLKLVNALLDFSRIQAGRVNAQFERIDICSFTAELASLFRSAIEKGGLIFNVNCSRFSSEVFVDREMWEKIVLNLLSNAFKFTLSGTVTLDLYQSAEDDSICLKVSDTGIGIPESELPKLFERFHRVATNEGRSFEGTGIGLALVQELVRLHGGSISVKSQVGVGTTFLISIPKIVQEIAGSHTENAKPLELQSIYYAEEAQRWLPEESGTLPPGLPIAGLINSAHSTRLNRDRILLADDNVDMRDYVRRLLAEEYEVFTAANGQIALELSKTLKPDLIVTDVMMPELDGFGLLQALRSNPVTKSVPVIMLSARAGEDAHIEGLQSGADDYLIKPFNARELLARVRTQILLKRRSSQFETLIRQSPIGVYVVDSGLRIVEANPVALPVFGDLQEDIMGRDLADVFPRLWSAAYARELLEIFQHTLRTGEPYSTLKRAEYRVDRQHHEYYEWRVDRISMPEGGYGVVCYFRDISRQVSAEEALRKSEKLAAVGRLASTISHEINNPLEAVTNLLYLMRNEAKEGMLPIYLRQAEEELRRASEVVQYSLKFHRQSTRPLPESISDLMKSTLSVFESRTRHSDISVVDQFLETSRLVCHGSDLRQVFSNLITNAVDALGGSGVLTVRSRDSRDWQSNEPGVRVTIADTGTGMSPATQAKIFEPFYTTKGVNGSGLGLWLSAEILKRQNARVKVRSRVGTGTAFHIFFPLKNARLEADDLSSD